MSIEALNTAAGVALMVCGLALLACAVVLAARRMSQPQPASVRADAQPSSGVPVEVALAAVTREAMQMAEDLDCMLRRLLQPLVQYDRQMAEPLRNLKTSVEAGYQRIQHDLASMRPRVLQRADMQCWSQLMEFAVALVQVARIAERVVRSAERDGGGALGALPREAVAGMLGSLEGMNALLCALGRRFLRVRHPDNAELNGMQAGRALQGGSCGIGRSHAQPGIEITDARSAEESARPGTPGTR